jgi:hypothetical protein
VRVWTGSEHFACSLEIANRNHDLLRPTGHSIERACSHIRLAIGAFDTFAAKESADDLGLGLVRSDGHDYEIVHLTEFRQESAILGWLGRIAQRESARFTRGRSLVRSQVRPSSLLYERASCGGAVLPNGRVVNEVISRASPGPSLRTVREEVAVVSRTQRAGPAPGSAPVDNQDLPQIADTT